MELRTEQTTEAAQEHLPEPQPLTTEETDTASPQEIVRRLGSKNAVEREKAAADLRKLGPDAFEALLDTVKAESQKYQKCKRNSQIVVGTLVGIMVLVFVGGLIHAAWTGNWRSFGDFSAWWPFYGAGFSGAVAASRLHTNAASELAKYDDVRTVGLYVDLLDVQDRGLRTVARDTLARLLPQIQAGNANLLSDSQRQTLAQALLKGRNEPLSKAILQAFTQIGDTRVLPQVQRVADGKGDGSWSVDVRVAARDCLFALQLRQEQEQAAQTLLRASASAETPQELLRASQSVPDTAPQELLRSSGPGA